ncbi:dihydrolipoamide acetyltransferase family protein [Streptomyces sp. Pv4-95]|uniref:dihydrolipoamide acetyltransferase family protein n=1 Tax=Streptomyces sp. Pv4-95 TaxID=3049543 RepID=UPI00389173BC
MAVVREFTLPDLGEGLTEATIVHWMVEVGEVVAIDQPVVEVETAKALVEVPCPYGGVVTARFGEEGAEVPVGAPLVMVAVGAVPDDLETGGPAADSGEAGATESGSATASGRTGASDQSADAGAARAGSADSGSADSGSADSGSGNVLVGYGTSASAARRRRIRPGAGGGPASGTAAGIADSAAAVPEGSSAVAEATGTAARAGTAGSAGADGAAESVSPEAELSGSRAVAVISPLVRRMAREHGLDLREVTGTGREGLILRTDVERAIRGQEHAAGAAATGATTAVGMGAADAVGAGAIGTGAIVTDAVGTGSGVTGTVGAGARLGARGATVSGVGGGFGAASESRVGTAPGAERVPLRGMRGAAAEKFSRSRREIPDATCWVDADATELLAARKAMNVPGAAKVSLLALLARVCTAALARFPELNATVDTESQEIVRLPAVHLGFAAQTERGLVVPVIRDAHARTAEQLSDEIARLTDTARSGGLSLAEMTHGTFTLNNYGVFGVDGSTPIINHPEAAMLGVGRIAAKPWVHNGELAVRQVVQLSFTFDHRVCDGATAGGFLRFVADCVEQPALLLRAL